MSGTAPRSDGLDVVSVVERYLYDVLAGPNGELPEDLVANAVLRHKVVATRQAFPDLRVSLQRLVVNGSLAAAHVTASGTHGGFFEGVPPTNRPWSASFTAVYRVVDGRIVDFWENWDSLGILEQVGAIRRMAGASA